MLFDPPAVVGLKFLLFDDDCPFMVGFQLFNSGFRLSLCLVSNYLCIVQLLPDITLQLLHLFSMLTQ
jgi:hypothetical protein